MNAERGTHDKESRHPLPVEHQVAVAADGKKHTDDGVHPSPSMEIDDISAATMMMGLGCGDDGRTDGGAPY